MIRRPPRSTLSSSSAASDVYKRQIMSKTNTYATSLILDEYDEKSNRIERAPPSPSESTLPPKTNPFSNQHAYSLPTTPRFGRSRHGSITPGTPHSQMTFIEKPRFRSRRYKKEDIQQPWLVNKDRKAMWAWIFPYLGIFIGIAATAVQCYLGWVSVAKFEYCPGLCSIIVPFVCPAVH